MQLPKATLEITHIGPDLSTECSRLAVVTVQFGFTGSYFVAVQYSGPTGLGRVLERNSMNVSHPIKTFQTEDT